MCIRAPLCPQRVLSALGRGVCSPGGSPRPRGRKLFLFTAALASALSVPTQQLSLALTPSSPGTRAAALPEAGVTSPCTQAPPLPRPPLQPSTLQPASVWGQETVRCSYIREVQAGKPLFCSGGIG